MPDRPTAPPPWADGEPCFMGVLNVTPDSFSDGGAFADVAAAVAQARTLAAEGADILDIGGESTRPGFTPVSAEVESARVLPVLDALGDDLPVAVSVDTTKPAVARLALARGVTIVNDIWGLQGDPAMAHTIAEAGAAVVVMHNRREVDGSIDIGADLERFFAHSLAIAERAGIPAARIALDPGVGFGKTPDQQVEAIRAIPVLRRRFGLPILVGLSRKSVLKSLTGSALARRLPDTIAANLAAYTLGASIFRVHDVADHVAAFAAFRGLAARPDR